MQQEKYVQRAVLRGYGVVGVNISVQDSCLASLHLQPDVVYQIH
jgi:hypothetical protein